MAFNFKRLFSTLNTSNASGPQRVVGVDIGSSSVKVVELEQGEKALRLTTYGELQLGPYAQEPLGSNVVLPLAQRTEALVDVLRESDVQASKVVITLPLAGSFVTTIAITAKPQDDIAPRVNVEARKYIPVPLTDVALEWVEVDPLKNTPQSVREVLVAAIQNDVLADSRKLLASIQKTSGSPEIEVFSVIRAITKETDESLAIIVLGAKTSKLYISEGGFLRRIHRVQGGGALATQRVADLLSVSFEEAENIKRNFSSEAPKASDIKKVVLSSYERPLQEFKRALSQYEVRSGSEFSRVVITGGSTLFPDFQQFTNYALDRQTFKSNPFTKVGYPAFMEDTITDIAPTFTVALGAALRAFE